MLRWINHTRARKKHRIGRVAAKQTVTQCTEAVPTAAWRVVHSIVNFIAISLSHLGVDELGSSKRYATGSCRLNLELCGLHLVEHQLLRRLDIDERSRVLMSHTPLLTNC
jgi:hypothetical protein